MDIGLEYRRAQSVRFLGGELQNSVSACKRMYITGLPPVVPYPNKLGMPVIAVALVTTGSLLLSPSPVA